MAWYNKYRPTTFDQVIGQDLVKSVLQNALKKNKIKHAYLFSGSKGIGKTTLARIFAGRLNEIDSNPEARIDIIELDAASNTGIDNIRQLIESAKVPPISGKYKVYIIDEVHMLSKAAMNALLKILEEPPIYLVFLLATTNPEKLIPTVVSRLTKLNLQPHSETDLVQKLKEIAAQENVQIDENSLKIIAKRAEGSHRDSINLLETLAGYELDDYNSKTVSELLGILPDELLQVVAESLLEGKIDKSQIQKIEQLETDGQTFLAQLMEFLIDQSFDGQPRFESLILPIAKTLDLKLPTNSVTASLAVLQRFFSEKLSGQSENFGAKVIFTESTKKKAEASLISSNFENSVVVVNEKKANYSFSEISPELYENLHCDKQDTLKVNEKKDAITVEGYNSDANDNKNHQNSDQSAVSKIENLSLEIAKNLQLPDVQTLQKFVDNLTKLKDSPPILKMIISDLVVQNIENSKISLSASNGIFLAQLKSVKVQNFISQKINEAFNQNLQLVINQRTENKISKPNYFTSEPEQNSTPENVENYESFSYSKEKTEPESGKIFYSVYNKLPENMENSGVEVTLPPILPPEIKQSEWDKHAEDMFELD